MRRLTTHGGVARSAPRWLRLLVALVALATEARGQGLDVGDEIGGDPFGGIEALAAPGADLEFADDPENPELVLFQDLPVVISASRRAQPINLSSIPVSVIDAGSIHHGGRTQLPDLIYFTPAVDVLYSDRNNASIGVRGLHHPFADRTLVLIDGRNAGDPITGGADFFRLPVLPEDISRIEIVRGPGGAAWGANAFHGIVNFIMKEPEDVLGTYGSTTVNEYGDSFHHLRWAHKIDQLSWRLSLGYEDRESSEDAVSGDRFFSRDFARLLRLDGEFIYRPAEDTKLSFGVGGVHLERGDFEFGGEPLSTDPRRDEQIEVLRLHGRLDRELDASTSFYVQWFSNIVDLARPGFAHFNTVEHDLESQLNLTAFDHHAISVGGNLRWDSIETERGAANELFDDAEEDEFWSGLFVIDRWQVRERLAIEGQARVDWYSETEFDWSGRLSGLLALDDATRHVLRLSGAKAFRAPLYGIRESGAARFPVGPPAFGLRGFNLLPAHDLKNEEIWALEAGYSGRWLESLSFRLDSYYQIYEDLIGADTLPDPAGLGRFFGRLRNIDGATGWGAETELTYTHDRVRASIWYAYNGFEDDQSSQSARAFRPAPHKAGFNLRVTLPFEIVAQADYKYTARTPNEPSTLPGSGDIPEHHRLDLAISREICERFEVLFGVTDVFDETSDRLTAIGSFTSHDTPGRTFFVRGVLRF